MSQQCVPQVTPRLPAVMDFPTTVDVTMPGSLPSVHVGTAMLVAAEVVASARHALPGSPLTVRPSALTSTQADAAQSNAGIRAPCIVVISGDASRITHAGTTNIESLGVQLALQWEGYRMMLLELQSLHHLVI